MCDTPTLPELLCTLMDAGHEAHARNEAARVLMDEHFQVRGELYRRTQSALRGSLRVEHWDDLCASVILTLLGASANVHNRMMEMRDDQEALAYLTSTLQRRWLRMHRRERRTTAEDGTVTRRYERLPETPDEDIEHASAAIHASPTAPPDEEAELRRAMARVQAWATEALCPHVASTLRRDARASFSRDIHQLQELYRGERTRASLIEEARRGDEPLRTTRNRVARRHSRNRSRLLDMIAEGLAITEAHERDATAPLPEPWRTWSQSYNIGAAELRAANMLYTEILRERARSSG